MMKKAIAGASAEAGPPPDWDRARDGNCRSLPIRTEPADALQLGCAVKWCESAWEPSPQELTWLHHGGQVVLRVYGMQPPVALYVEPPPPDDSEPRPAAPAATMDRERVQRIAAPLMQAVRDNLVAGPPSIDRGLEALNALAFAVATVLAGTGNDPDAASFFRSALSGNLRLLLTQDGASGV